MTDEKTITVDELEQLRGLLRKLREQPDVRMFQKDHIMGVYSLTSVLLDERRLRREGA